MIITLQENMQRKFTKMQLSLESRTLGDFFFSISQYFPDVKGVFFGHPWWFSGKEPTYQYRRHKFDPWVRKTPGEGNGNPFQYSCLGHPTDRGARWATVHELVQKPDTAQQLNNTGYIYFYTQGLFFPHVIGSY